ncbi:MAG: hypothetical protein ACM3JB_24305 [Acidobacteriaceae bacterium]
MAMDAEMIAIDILKTIHEIWSRVYGLDVKGRSFFDNSRSASTTIAQRCLVVTVTNVGIKGYDPVAYFTQNLPVTRSLSPLVILTFAIS